MCKCRFLCDVPADVDAIERLASVHDDAAPAGSDDPCTGVLASILGSGKNRYGPLPSPECQRAMLDLIVDCMSEGRPIPILVPSGPKKPTIGRGVDVAELSVLKVLNCLRVRVERFHVPGIEVVVRLEDVTGWFLEDDVVGARESMDLYMSGFEALVEVLELGFIRPVRESVLMGESEFREESTRLSAFVLDYVRDTDSLGLDGYESLASYRALTEQGWQGCIPLEQREFYHGTYAKLFPWMDQDGRNVLMSRYLASTLARYKMRGTGGDHWGKFIQLNFAPPVPGIPKGLVSRRVHYRTVPTDMSARHIPFWRARGCVDLSPTPRVVLRSWLEDVGQVVPSTLLLSEGDRQVSVAADVLIGAN